MTYKKEILPSLRSFNQPIQICMNMAQKTFKKDKGAYKMMKLYINIHYDLAFQHMYSYISRWYITKEGMGMKQPGGWYFYVYCI